ncbi:MAG TPA: hypothetical protein VEA58_05690 [Anaerovoracaceae bacterium]|nr:hypothetical protein [Anaerovoracaceae bacterium]
MKIGKPIPDHEFIPYGPIDMTVETGYTLHVGVAIQNVKVKPALKAACGFIMRNWDKPNLPEKHCTKCDNYRKSEHLRAELHALVSAWIELQKVGAPKTEAARQQLRELMRPLKVDILTKFPCKANEDFIKACSDSMAAARPKG